MIGLANITPVKEFLTIPPFGTLKGTFVEKFETPGRTAKCHSKKVG